MHLQPRLRLERRIQLLPFVLAADEQKGIIALPVEPVEGLQHQRPAVRGGNAADINGGISPLPPVFPVILACRGERPDVRILGKDVPAFPARHIHNVHLPQQPVGFKLQDVLERILAPSSRVFPFGKFLWEFFIKIAVKVSRRHAHAVQFPNETVIFRQDDRIDVRFDIAEIGRVRIEPLHDLPDGFLPARPFAPVLADSEELHLVSRVEKRPVHFLRTYRGAGLRGFEIDIGNIQDFHGVVSPFRHPEKSTVLHRIAAAAQRFFKTAV